jgi:hypothetical protein
MKTIYYMLTLLIFISGIIIPQRGKWQDEEMRAKFEQLEKIKLIETLEMDEETTLRFFARKSEHQKQQEEIQEKIKENINNLEVIFKSGRVATIEEIKASINEINSMQLQVEQNRADFINSLSDILSYEQIAKLLIFERNFKDEIRKLIMKERRPPPPDQE